MDSNCFELHELFSCVLICVHIYCFNIMVNVAEVWTRGARVPKSFRKDGRLTLSNFYILIK